MGSFKSGFIIRLVAMQDEMLDTISEYAQRLKRINLRQLAGDYDYIVSWLKSPIWNHGEHLRPHPAGKNTIDAYSHNCPIPYYTERDIFLNCYSLSEAIYIVKSATDIFMQLKSETSDEDEKIAYESYIENNVSIIHYVDENYDPEHEDTNEVALFGILDGSSSIDFKFDRLPFGVIDSFMM